MIGKWKNLTKGKTRMALIKMLVNMKLGDENEKLCADKNCVYNNYVRCQKHYCGWSRCIKKLGG